jgi:hypothetical protein
VTLGLSRYRKAGTENFDKNREVRVLGSEQENVKKVEGNCRMGNLKIHTY